MTEVLANNIDNIQCKHIILACGHDSGYAGALRPYATKASGLHQISLLATGTIRTEILNLGFKSTTMFMPLFQCGDKAVAGAGQAELWSAKLTSAVPNQLFSEPGSSLVEKPIPNSRRLGLVLYGPDGKRVDRKLKVDKNLVNAMNHKGFCFRHYLRGDCVKPCGHKHDYPSPLNDKDFDAMWYLCRSLNKCRQMMNGGNCRDDGCMFGH
jgi:hypothetical protein